MPSSNCRGPARHRRMPVGVPSQGDCVNGRGLPHPHLPRSACPKPRGSLDTVLHSHNLWRIELSGSVLQMTLIELLILTTSKSGATGHMSKSLKPASRDPHAGPRSGARQGAEAHPGQMLRSPTGCMSSFELCKGFAGSTHQEPLRVACGVGATTEVENPFQGDSLWSCSAQPRSHSGRVMSFHARG
jgi:hypothetical protein